LRALPGFSDPGQNAFWNLVFGFSLELEAWSLELEIQPRTSLPLERSRK
jgi:hypothetical protein